MTLVEGEELQRLWALVTELSSQLSSNQTLCQSLQAQADELKGQALHSGTGYTLRRFNLDISKEKFESDLERINAQLVLENQALAHDNKQSNLLLREYEGILETIMAKFRSFSHATQQHTLALTQHYESLLANHAHDSERAELRANTALSEHLVHLGSLVRTALREIDGEALENGFQVAGDDTDMEDDRSVGSDVQNDHVHHLRRKGMRPDPFEAEGYSVGSPSGGLARTQLSVPEHVVTASSSASSTSSAMVSSTGKSKKKHGYGSARTRDPRWYGTGGYTGVAGDPDAEAAERALEIQIEEERLRHENEILRELLRVSADFTPEIAHQLGIHPPPPQPPSGWAGEMNAIKLSLGKPRGARKSQEAEKAGSSSDQEPQKSPETTSDEAQQPPSPYILDQEGSHTDKEADAEEHMAAHDGDTDKLDIPISTMPSSPPNNGVVVEHVTGGAGGPPQLSDETNRTGTGPDTLEQPSGGLLIAASMGEERNITAGTSGGRLKGSNVDKPVSPPLESVPLDTEAILEFKDGNGTSDGTRNSEPQKVTSPLAGGQEHLKNDDTAAVTDPSAHPVDSITGAEGASLSEAEEGIKVRDELLDTAKDHLTDSGEASKALERQSEEGDEATENTGVNTQASK